MSDVPRLCVAELHARLRDGSELALLDVREQGDFGRAHILLASNLPLGRLELGLLGLVPRRSTGVVLCDAGEGLAERAHSVLRAAGYANVWCLAGGVSAWGAAGHELFSGLNVPSKAFGEYVEHRYDTPRWEAAEIVARLDAGEDIVILDSRPPEEFEAMCIPGGIDVPGAELVYRVRDLAPHESTTVIVNCAGRTRSIIGCQSLVNAGLPNPVAALKDGTMGWTLAGEALEHGARRSYGPVSGEGLAWSRQSAARVAERFEVRRVAASQLERWRGESETRTLYVFDVRQRDEYEAGHLPGARWAQGGQLVQATDDYLAVRNARIVLVDDTEVRATMTASWLNQMGYPEVFVLAGGIEGQALEEGPEPRRACLAMPGLETVRPAALAELEDACIIDFSSSLAHAARHIPGAGWGVRSALPGAAAELPAAGTYVVTADDVGLAALAGDDLRRLVKGRVLVLEGGNRAWRAAGLPTESGMGPVLIAGDDLYERPYDLDRDQEAAMRAYLEWEVALVEQIKRDSTLSFPEFA